MMLLGLFITLKPKMRALTFVGTVVFMVGSNITTR